MLGEHPSIKKIYEIIQRVAATDVTILLTGESGTGKELVARAIHNLSLRTNRPFVPVNCAAIPENLPDAEPPTGAAGPLRARGLEHRSA